MEPIPPDLGFVTWIVEHLWVPLITGAWFVGKSAYGVLEDKIGEVKLLAEQALEKERFEQHLDDQREYRQHREAIDNRLFAAISDHSATTDRKFDEIRRLIMERVK